MSSASGAAAADAQPSTSAPRKTGFVFHELYCWWTQGSLGNHANRLQPIAHWESAESKRRLHNLLEVSGLMDELQRIKPRPATKEELAT